MIGRILSVARILPLVALMVALPVRAKAAAITTLFVSSTSGSDANPCTSGSPCKTIGHAISLANSGDTINVAAGLYSTPNEVFPLTINLALTITGAGASRTIIDAQQTHRVISHTGTGNLSISGVTIQGGKTPEGIGNGGGILDNSTATLTLVDSVVTRNAATNDGGGIAEEGGGTVNLTNCTVSHNTADDDGGGIAEDGGGTINLMNCTISDNRGSRDGGGIAEEGSGTVHLINCTISANTTDGFGGGIAADGGGIITMNNCTISNNRAPTGGGIDNDAGDTVTLANTIVANNPGGDCATTSGSSITSNGHNLDSDDTCGLSTALGDLINTNPRLGPLALNPPGTTATRGLIVGSPAINAGDPGPSDGMGNHCEPTDQRGVTRPQPPGAACDIGAFEGQIAPPSNTAPALGVSGLLVMILGLAALGARRLRYRTVNASGRTA